MKRALVISGGGSRGSFAVGAASYLMEALGLEFDVFAGTSTGALIAPLLAARGRDALPELRKQYTTVKTSDIIRPRILNPFKLALTSWYYTDPLRKRVNDGVTDALFKQLVDSGKQLFVTTVDLQTGKIVYFQTGAPVTMKGDAVVPITRREQLVDAMVASSSIPFFMPPQPIAVGGQTDPVVDGGVREYAPIHVAIEAGATEIYCLVLMPDADHLNETPKKYDDIVKITQRTIDLLSREVGDSDIKLSQLYSSGIDYVNDLRVRLKQAIPGSVADIDRVFDAPGSPFDGKVSVTLHVIRPDAPLAGDTLRFDPGEMTANMHRGCEIAESTFPLPGAPKGWCKGIVP
jgi:predicted acylesterase/phospholipase RssA